jgi:hypothetical protein
MFCQGERMVQGDYVAPAANRLAGPAGRTHAHRIIFTVCVWAHGITDGPASYAHYNFYLM